MSGYQVFVFVSCLEIAILTTIPPDKMSLPDKTSILTKVCRPKLRDVEDKMITEWVEDQPPGIFSAPGVGQFLVASCQLRQLNGRPQLSGRPKMFLYDHQYSLMCLQWFILAFWSGHIPWSNSQPCQREIHQLLQQKNSLALSLPGPKEQVLVPHVRGHVHPWANFWVGWVSEGPQGHDG